MIISFLKINNRYVTADALDYLNNIKKLEVGVNNLNIHKELLTKIEQENKKLSERVDNFFTWEEDTGSIYWIRFQSNEYSKVSLGNKNLMSDFIQYVKQYHIYDDKCNISNIKHLRHKFIKLITK